MPHLKRKIVADDGMGYSAVHAYVRPSGLVSGACIFYTKASGVQRDPV